ncbi:MAG TPA: 23S rRNA (pseudouridine(1915)-N(3))-methyltransferase RlmH [Terriglobia bacterium]|nr:23S rRNA (pseudouridine(1915)-N(3))-methyltransferase RlmH [Terriglobia bacterium]
MRIRVIWEGKTKDAHLRALQADYQARIARLGELVVEQLAPLRGQGHASGKASSSERRLLDRLKERAGEGYTVLLDSHGREWTSQEFGEWLGQRALHGTRELVFVVGGPEGFSSAFREEADLLLSLSRLTLTHDWARTLLLEQIYRGFTMLRGYPYPR